MREKLRNSRGETLVEVLVSVLVCALSITLLAGAVTASANIDLRAQAADTEYYTALSKAERQSRTPAGGSSEADTYNSLPGETKVSVTSGGGGSVEIEPDATSKLYFYGTERLLSYAIDKPEPAPDPGTGGGG
nr:hypothetical protein [uncultured Oscillibacter sp.]